MAEKQVAPGVLVPGTARRVVYEGHPREADYLAAAQAVREIRSDMSRIRRRLETMQLIETNYAHDSQALRAAGAVHCAIVALHELEEGDRSFVARADRTRRLWEAVAASPDQYVREPGSSGGTGQTQWKWEDWNWEP